MKSDPTPQPQLTIKSSSRPESQVQSALPVIEEEPYNEERSYITFSDIPDDDSDKKVVVQKQPSLDLELSEDSGTQRDLPQRQFTSDSLDFGLNDD